MEPNLGTTNLLLGILAAASVLEALVMVVMSIAAFVIYKQVNDLIASLEARHVAPAMTRVNAILNDVKGVTSRVREETERVDDAIHSTMDRIDDTADRVRWNVRAKTSRLIGIVRGARVVIEELLRPGSRH